MNLIDECVQDEKTGTLKKDAPVSDKTKDNYSTNSTIQP